ncbi:MAG: gamma-glutamyl-gamma-aminobutyrate hydrolase family protein [Bdellovibrionota bacterium]
MSHLKNIAYVLVFVFCSLTSSFVMAQELVVWRASPSAPKVVLPMRGGETPRQAVEAYFASMSRNRDMAKLFASRPMPDLSGSVYSQLPDLSWVARTRTAVQGNIADDILSSGTRIASVLNVLANQKAAGYVIPPAAALRLNAAEQYRFQDAIYDSFDVRGNLGGDDLHPKTYGQDITHSRREELNLTRDKYEIQLIRHWAMRNARAKAEGKDGKPEFGICRGHDAMAVSTQREQIDGSLRTKPAEGHTMFQDNIRDGASRDGTHLDRLGNPALRNFQHWHHIYVVDSLIAELIGRTGDVLVNDWHHQSVKANPKARTRVVALAPDGVVEALESPDRLTVSVQFHPEFEVWQSQNQAFSDMGHRLLGGIFRLGRMQRTLRECSGLFRVVKQ